MPNNLSNLTEVGARVFPISSHENNGRDWTLWTPVEVPTKEKASDPNPRVACFLMSTKTDNRSEPEN